MKYGERVYAERLRMVLDGIGQSFAVGFFLSTLLVIVYWLSSRQVLSAISAESGLPTSVISAPIDLARLLWWYVAFLLGRVALVSFARLTSRRTYPNEAVPGIVRWLLIGKLYEGTVWGILGWIVLAENSSPGATALLLGLMAAISSNGVSLLSPMIGLYLGLMLPMLLLAACRFLTMEGILYQAMGVCCLLYVVAQYGQARLIGRALSNSIQLRFENTDLIEGLKVEKNLAGEAREAAEQADVAKSRFLAAASHDLRQPVHAMGLFLEALSHSSLDHTQHQVLDNAKAASLASADMLNTLLDFSRIEAGVIRPKLVPCSLQTLLNKLEIELAPQADAKGLIYRSRETTLVALSDPALLELILRNLIANAIRYTDKGGILIGCRRRGKKVCIKVYDTGIGIEASQHREIFREFHQLGNPERDRRKGLGLGLAIADGLARSMDSKISLVSRVGRGSSFSLEITITSRTPMAFTGVVASRVSIPDQLIGKNVLVVDDDEAVRMSMSQVLCSWGMRCEIAESLQEALELDMPECPDLIICDYRLREQQTGDRVIVLLREHFGASIPAILVTGDTAPKRLRDATATQIPLLHKPVAAEQLKTTLIDTLSSAP